MRLCLMRVAALPEATFGVISVLHPRLKPTPICWSLEDQAQPSGKKIPGETRIPAGIYPIALYTAGRMHGLYRDRYAWHRGMLQLVSVPGFSCILIHPGNDDGDTRGCLLVGRTAELDTTPRLIGSIDAYSKLYQCVVADALRGDLDIVIYDEPQIYAPTDADTGP